MIPALGLSLGIFVGLFLHPPVPVWLQPYLPIAVIAALDAVFGAVRAVLDGIFDDKVFVVSFLSNVVVAAFIVFLGDKLGVGSQLSTGVVVVLGVRIFSNVAAIRRHLFRRMTEPTDPATGPRRRPTAAPTVGRPVRPGDRGGLAPAGAGLAPPAAGSPRPNPATCSPCCSPPLGFAIIAQVRQTQLEGLENLREDDLVRILAGVDQDGERLPTRSAPPVLARPAQAPVATSRGAARPPASGWTRSASSPAPSPATGPGIVLTISDPERKVDAPTMLDTVQELRDAGAEAIQIDDVRVVAEHLVRRHRRRPVGVRRRRCSRPTSSGDRRRQDARRRDGHPGRRERDRAPGGRGHRGQTQDEVEVNALLTRSPPQYARPVPTPTP